MPNLTKKDLADTLFEKMGLSKRESKKITEVFFDEIVNAFEREEEVLLSNFGNFELRDKNARPGRNPRTNQPVPIESRRVVVFHPSLKLKDKVQEREEGNLSEG